MIVMGYPGIGKTTYAKEDKSFAIDLESSLFPDKEQYVDVAINLEAQGYIVFVSCHDEVCDLLIKKALPEVELAICYPSPELLLEWDVRLRKRVIFDPSEKNKAAYQRFGEHFLDDIYNFDKNEKFNQFTKIRLSSPKYRFITYRAYKYPYGNNVVRKLDVEHID